MSVRTSAKPQEASNRNGYLRSLGDYCGRAWNEFWYPPASGDSLRRVRLAVGMLALGWQLSFTPDLLRWFGASGWLDARVYHAWVLAELDSWPGRLSLLFGSSTIWLVTAHVVSAVILLAFAISYRPRATAILAWVVLLSYVHRVPFTGGTAEHVLTMVVGYLAWAPAACARRLIQVHLAIVYALMFTTKLASPVWWNGEAIWWVNAQSLTGWQHLTFLRDYPIMLNLWTFGMLASELAMFTLVWNRTLRPLVVTASVVSWLMLTLATGRIGLSLVMIGANLAFLDGGSDDVACQTLEEEPHRNADHRSRST